MAPASSQDLKALAPILIKQLIAWGPVVIGLVHQFLMFLFNIQCIYVFVDPPGYIRPAITLEFQWWLVLVVGSGVVCILAYSDRLKSIPRRAALPFYLYLLFLLIFVKPVAHHGGELPAKCGPEATPQPTPAGWLNIDPSLTPRI